MVPLSQESQKAHNFYFLCVLYFMKTRSKSIIIISLIVVWIWLFSSRFIYEQFYILWTSDFKSSILAFSENECEKKWLSCTHEYSYYISPKWVYIQYDTNIYNKGWKFFPRDSFIWRELITRIEWLSIEKQRENMKDFPYESLNLKYISRWAFQ